MRRLGLAIGGLFALAAAALASVTTVTFEERRVEPSPVRPRAASVPASEGLLLPVQGFDRSALSNSWGDARSGGRGHRGLDLVAVEGTPVIAAAEGTVEKLFNSELGGTTLYLRSGDREWVYYYAHLAGYASGMREGLKVGAGQVLGYVGDTGDAGDGNHHLHFGASRMRPGERWWQGEDVDPYPLLADQRGRR